MKIKVGDCNNNIVFFFYQKSQNVLFSNILLRGVVFTPASDIFVPNKKTTSRLVVSSNISDGGEGRKMTPSKTTRTGFTGATLYHGSGCRCRVRVIIIYNIILLRLRRTEIAVVEAA